MSESKESELSLKKIPITWGKGEEAEKRFSFEKTLANTLQGRIYLGTDKDNEKHIIIKEAWKSLIAKQISRTRHKIHENFEEEVALMVHISSKKDCPDYICKSIDNWEDNEAFFVAMEKCDIGLFEYIKICHKRMRIKSGGNGKEFSKKNSKWMEIVGKIFNQICHSVNWLHSNNIVHLDLSLENIMLVKNDGKYSPKIIDFGLGKLFKKNADFSYKKKVGKTNYMASEVYNGETFDARAADIHTLGVILFMMLTGAPPYEKPTKRDQLYNLVTNGKMNVILKSWKFMHKMTKEAYDLIDKIIKPEKTRITMKDILTHDFVTQFDEKNNQDNDDKKEKLENIGDQKENQDK